MMTRQPQGARLSGAELEGIARYRRTTNYLAAAQIYLQDNVLLDEPLRSTHIKDRLLGHWGTCPGINLIYAHLNRLIRERDAKSPTGKMGDAWDVANAALFLASDEAKYVNGVCLPVDGGHHLKIG